MAELVLLLLSYFVELFEVVKTSTAKTSTFLMSDIRQYSTVRNSALLNTFVIFVKQIFPV